MFQVKKRKTKSSSTIIKLLVSFLIVVLFIYLVYPYWPKVQYYFSEVVPKNTPSPISYALLNTSAAKEDTPIQVEDISDKNVLSIPKINVETNIVEGNSLDILNSVEGVWREPESSTPIVAGNMVLAGHRFQYLPPNTNTFYNLEEMKIGDDIYIYWQGKTFWYKVYSTMLVNPDQVEIRLPDPALVREITLYTCTPLYTSDQRFVVKANLVGYE